MTSILKSISLATALFSYSAHSFAPILPASANRNMAVAAFDRPSGMALSGASIPTETVDVAMEPISPPSPQQQNQIPKIGKAKKPAHGKEGLLSPVVLAAKIIMGNDDARFNKLRAKAISLHSEIIEHFVVERSETQFGKGVLERLFRLADRDHNGSIDEQELAMALQSLGFVWLKEKQVHKIFSRADSNEDGRLELAEWLAEAPKTLRTNLIKLAKKNGGELGLLV